MTRACAWWLCLLLLACPKPRSSGITVGDFSVEVSIAPDPPTTGDNQLRVTLRDSAGKPVDGAQLAFEYDMPAMGAMPEMKGGGDVRPEGEGRYVITYPLSMAGDWYLTLGVDAPGRGHAALRLKVSPPRPGFVVEGQRGGAGVGQRLIEVPTDRRQMIGVTFAPVETRPLAITIRAAGRVEVDERKLSEVTLKYEAYVQKLLVAETGKAVKAGTPLLSLYSPDLLAAEEELLATRRSGGAKEIVEAAARRLAYWDISREQLSELERKGQADGRVTVAAPTSGVVLEKLVVEGAHVMPGQTLYRIGDLGRIWIQTALYERDTPLVSVGQAAKVTLPALPGIWLGARINFIAPTVDEKTRTLEARLELVQADLRLKPGMFADVAIEAPLGDRLSVPDSALLLSGGHSYAFVDRGEGRLEAVEVRVGARAGDYAEVTAGLDGGERVATGATFLLSSEAKLRDALPRWSQ